MLANSKSSLFLLQLPGLSRYDTPICEINTNCIKNWQRFKTKLDLSQDECKELYKLVKTKLNIKVEEKSSQNSINLIFSKPLLSESFNDLFREFIKINKICGRCNVPELVDKKCKACGYNCNKSVTVSSTEVKENTKKEKISKVDKRALKVAKQKDSNNKSNEDSSDEKVITEEKDIELKDETRT